MVAVAVAEAEDAELVFEVVEVSAVLRVDDTLVAVLVVPVVDVDEESSDPPDKFVEPSEE